MHIACAEIIRDRLKLVKYEAKLSAVKINNSAQTILILRVVNNQRTLIATMVIKNCKGD